MSIRNEALAQPAFAKMKAVCDNRKGPAKAWKAQGGKVAAYLGYDVPDELLMAAGILPYRICGDPDRHLEETERYLEFSFPLDVRSQFEGIIGGVDQDVMDYLIISNSTDADQRIYFYIREVKALEPEKNIPDLYFIDWSFTKYRMHQVRNERIIAQFRAQLEDWIGHEISDEAIREAGAECNRNRQLLEEASKLRRAGKITGSEAMVIITASVYMPKAEHSALLEELLPAAAQWPEVTGKKIFLTGSQQAYTALYEQLEDCGLNVVSEDHDYGDRQWNRQIDLSCEPVRGIVDRYMLRTVSAKRSFVSERVQSLQQAIGESGAQGLVSYTYRYDDAPSWDFPEVKRALQQESIPAISLLNRNYAADLSDIQDELKAFAEQI